MERSASARENRVLEFGRCIRLTATYESKRDLSTQCWNHTIIRYRMRALSRDRGPICPYKSTILDFLQKLPFAFAQNVLGRANFALINPPFVATIF